MASIEVADIEKFANGELFFSASALIKSVSHVKPLKLGDQYDPWLINIRKQFESLDPSAIKRSIFEDEKLAVCGSALDLAYRYTMDIIIKYTVDKSIRDQLALDMWDFPKGVAYTAGSMLHLIRRVVQDRDLDDLTRQLGNLLKPRKINDKSFLVKFGNSAEDFMVKLKEYKCEDLEIDDYLGSLMLTQGKSEDIDLAANQLDFSFAEMSKDLASKRSLRPAHKPHFKIHPDDKPKKERIKEGLKATYYHNPPYNFKDLQRIKDNKLYHPWVCAMKTEKERVKNTYAQANGSDINQRVIENQAQTRWIYWLERENARYSNLQKGTHHVKYRRKAKLILTNNPKSFYNFFYDPDWTPFAPFPIIRLVLKIFGNKKHMRLFDMSKTLLNTPPPSKFYAKAPCEKPIPKYKRQYIVFKSCIPGLDSDKWEQRYTRFFTKRGYDMIVDGVYVLKDDNDSVESVALALYDQLLVFDRDDHAVKTQSILDSFEESKCLGHPVSLLGTTLNYARDGKLLSINSFEFLRILLHQIGFIDHQVTESNFDSMFNRDDIRYIFTQLSFISEWSRPDIYALVKSLTLQENRLRPEHNAKMLELLRYLKATLNYSIVICDRSIPFEDNTPQFFISLWRNASFPFNIYADVIYPDSNEKPSSLSASGPKKASQFKRPKKFGIVTSWRDTILHWTYEENPRLIEAPILLGHLPDMKKMFGINDGQKWTHSVGTSDGHAIPFGEFSSDMSCPGCVSYSTEEIDVIPGINFRNYNHPALVLSGRFWGPIKPMFDGLLDDEAAIYSRYRKSEADRDTFLVEKD